MNMNMPRMILIGFDVHLHEKDQFWPRQGSSDHGDKVPSKITLMDGKLKRAESLKSKQMIMKVEIAPGLELEGSFSVTRTKELGLQNPCTEEEGYSFTACISSYVDNQVFTFHLNSQAGCALPWLSNTSSIPSCALFEAVNNSYKLG